MDELPPIKKLSATQLALREALKNRPQLRVQRPPVVNNFVIFDDHNSARKTSSQSLMDRFLSHKTSQKTAKDGVESPPKQRFNSGHKWSQLKTIMSQELETKRMETEKERELEYKLEEEDGDEDVDQLADRLTAEYNCNEDNDVESGKEEADDDNEDKSDEETVDSDVEEVVESGAEDEEEEDASDGDGNPFIDDEADDDEEVDESDDQIDEKPREDNSRRKGFGDNNGDKEGIPVVKDVMKVDDNSRQTSQSSVAEEESDDKLNESLLDTSITSLNESFSSDRQLSATQKIALSPFMTQKPKPCRVDSSLIPLIPKFDSQTTDGFTSQTLLDLCSGDFSESVDHKNEDEKSQSTQQSVDGDDEDKEEVLSDAKKVRKVFNIQSDGESDDEEVVKVTKVSKPDLKSEISLKSFNESDGEELVMTDAEVSDEEEADDDQQNEDNDNDSETAEAEERDVRKIGRSFFDDEAELSGDEDDVSSDEEEGDGDDHYDNDGADQEDLPSDEELRKQVERIHHKKLLDEDKRQLMVLKEMMFADGDLHDDDTVRQKKFRWNFGQNDDFVNDYVNEDSEGDYVDSDDEKDAAKSPALKMSLKMTVESETETKTDHNLEKLKSRFGLNLKAVNTTGDKEFVQKKTVNLQSFVVRDERLKTLCAPKRALPTNASHSFKSNKKLKASKKKETKVSIFDLM